MLASSSGHTDIVRQLLATPGMDVSAACKVKLGPIAWHEHGVI
jgi:hypothetical protein